MFDNDSRFDTNGSLYRRRFRDHLTFRDASSTVNCLCQLGFVFFMNKLAVVYPKPSGPMRRATGVRG